MAVRLITVSTEAFQAVVPTVGSLHVSAILPALEAYTDAERALAMFDLFRETLAPEKRADYDALGMDDMAVVINAWLEGSRP